MEINEYKNIFDNEESHFYYVATHALVVELIKKYANLNNRKPNILDAGCGTGLLAKKLEQFGQVTGVDFSPEALKYAKKRGVTTVRGSIDALPFKAKTFDIVVSIDVIVSKSIKNDMKVLREFHRVLKPGGVCIMRASANNWLKLIHDEHVHLDHRYERKELNDKLVNSGFSIQKLSYIHSFLFPLIVVRHYWEALTKPSVKSTIQKVSPVLNTLLTSLLLFEVQLFKLFNLPFGVGLVSVSKKI